MQHCLQTHTGRPSDFLLLDATPYMGGPVRKSGLGGTGVCVWGGGGLRSGPSSFAVYPGAGLPLVRTSKDAGQPQRPIFCGLAVHRQGH